jgi:formylglycine-generating enzyme required for sulfatase activity
MSKTPIIVISFVLSSFCHLAFANNIQVLNVKTTGKNTSAGTNNIANFMLVEFDLSWENSWRTSTAPFNWDAAWVFIKYRVGTGNWNHTTLNTTAANHTAPTGSIIEVPNDGKGAFIYRSSNGTGSFSLTDVQLRWQYGADGVADNAQVQIKVFAVEMVHVPQGSFRVGSGGSDVYEFYASPTTTSTYLINSENAITVGTANGNLYYPDGSADDQSGPIPAAFPKGYAAFYCMKYEVSQGQYRDFLNLLTYNQQASRTATAPNSAAGTGAFNNANRNGIDVQTPGISATKPAVYGCNVDGDAVYNESNDGEWIACNTVSWLDACAFLDWAALRPMTELEYEKACRGSETPVPNEYAWGTATKAAATYTLNNAGTANEGIATNYSTTLGNASYSTTSGSVNGPLRSGIFAANINNSGRISSGATYYGIMEMSGNLWERTVSVGNAAGRAYTGVHGDGVLSANGHANTTAWPGLISGEVTGADGAGFRGSGWNVTFDNRSRVSDRSAATSSVTDRATNRGIRGVRTAP